MRARLWLHDIPLLTLAVVLSWFANALNLTGAWCYVWSDGLAVRAGERSLAPRRPSGEWRPVAIALLVAGAIAMLFTSCSSTAPACDPPHRWEVRTDLAHEPHAFYWCTCGQHEPRTAEEADDAQRWYLTARAGGVR